MKVFKVFLVTCLIAAGLQVPNLPQARAGIAMGWIHFSNLCTGVFGICRPVDNFTMLFAGLGCLITLPFCVIGKEQAATEPTQLVFSTTDLVKQKGYSQDEADEILKDYRAHSSALAKISKAYTPTPDETPAELEAEVKQVYPEASHVYIKFISETAGF